LASAVVTQAAKMIIWNRIKKNFKHHTTMFSFDRLSNYYSWTLTAILSVHFGTICFICMCVLSISVLCNWWLFDGDSQYLYWTVIVISSSF
jgi:hypothetical protein